MATQKQEHPERETQQNPVEDHNLTDKASQNPDKDFNFSLSTYWGISFSVFLALLPKNSVKLLPNLQTQIKDLSFRLFQAEEQLKQMRSRRKEDSKANARVVEIFASHRNAWQAEERRLMQQADAASEETAYLRAKVADFERVEAEYKARIEELEREVGERDEMIGFMSRRSEFEDCGGGVGGGYGEEVEEDDGEGGEEEEHEERLNLEEVDVNANGFAGFEFGGKQPQQFQFLHHQLGSGFNAEFLAASASKLWAEKASLWQDVQHDSVGSLYHTKHFVMRRELPWRVDGETSGVASKLKVLEQELLNLEKDGKTDLSKVLSVMRKQAKRYQALAGMIDDLCRRMQASDPSDPTLCSGFQRQTEFLQEAFRLQQRATETGQKLTAVQTEIGKSYYREDLSSPAKLTTRRSMDSIRNNFKEIQRNLEIWLARIIGDLKGIMARDGASRVREYYVPRYPFVQ